MKKKQIGNITVLILVLLNIALWAIFPPANTLEMDYTRQFIGEAIASSVMVLISMTLILSARPRVLEPYFGGLDKIWKTHKNISITAFLAVILHFFTIPKTSYWLNGKLIGELAFLGIIVLVLITLAPRAPVLSRVLKFNYTRWRVAHKLLGVFFIMGLVHFMTVETISTKTIPGIYMLLFSFAGILAYIYRQFFSRMFEPYQQYFVEAVNRVNGQVADIILKPVKNNIQYAAGQFAYVYFGPGRDLREPHPFTISSLPKDQFLRLTIKSSGDWTGNLVKNLHSGMKAWVHGGFGEFDYKEGGKSQVWIAGGIGITPFLSWVRDMEGNKDSNPDRQINLFYTVRGPDDAIFWDEFQAADNAYPNFEAHLQLSSKEGHLSVEDILKMSGKNAIDAHFYMCGPAAMTENFANTLKGMGVRSDQIHYEEFNFR